VRAGRPGGNLGDRDGRAAGGRLTECRACGKAESLVLYQIEWRDDEPPDSLTTQAALASSFAPVDSILGQIQFSWHGVNHTFTSSDAPVHVGRAEHVQLCINDPRVSRLHARIDWRNSGFVLTDLSSFGTWVRFEGSTSPVRLRRDACILHGTGQIALGVSFSEPSAPVVSFEVAGASMHLK
jgi:adenylate cyclase